MKKKIIFVILLLLSFSIVYSQQTMFFIQLSEKEQATIKDGILMISYILDNTGELAKKPIEENIELLQKKGIIKGNEEIEKPIRYGKFCNMLMKTLEISGGIMYRITKANRYAYKDFLFYGIVPKGKSEFNILNGADMLSITARAKEYKDKKEDKKDKE